MRGVVALPEAARLKLQDLTLSRDSELDAARSSNARLQSLPNDTDQQMRSRLTTERDRHNARHRDLAGLLSRAQQWLMELPVGVTLEPAPAVRLEMKDGETLAAAVGACRDAITSVRQHLTAVKSAPLPPADQKELAVDFVFALLRTSRPSISVVANKLKVVWRDDIVTSKTDALALMAWADPQAVLRALEREIDALPVRADAMPKSEREQRAVELAARLLGLERAESAMIEHAAAAGQEILHRVDADPRAVLNVIVTAKEAAAA